MEDFFWCQVKDSVLTTINIQLATPRPVAGVFLDADKNIYLCAFKPITWFTNCANHGFIYSQYENMNFSAVQIPLIKNYM
jgi:hypothetical protein